MDIEWKITTVAGEPRSERLARLLARLILNAEDTLNDPAPPADCEPSRDGGKNEKIPSTRRYPHECSTTQNRRFVRSSND